MRIELIDVPFDGFGRDGRQARAAAALRDAGLVGALAPHTVEDNGPLRLPAFETRRGPQTGLLNEPALLAMTEQLNERVAAAVSGGAFPVVVGGDCALLLGVVTALRDVVERPGLLFLDGHEDTMPLDVVEDGEAANCEIGLLLGVTGRLLTGPLAQRLPALETDGLAMLGQRDDQWRRRFNVGSVSDLGVWSRPLGRLRDDPAEAARAATTHLRAHTDRWWLHVDLDVLDPEVFPAQGLPDYPDEPDGLDLAQLTAITTEAIGAGGCVGLSAAIYDPEQDPDGSCAAATVDLVRATVRAHR
ncbi:arginase family protein [Promicromonospora sp. NPDC060271]|uniref:arginase family protein n=1 Tax=Promicromonospora sp. NPDC060271 TaxID=3347089 RepID=UPI003656C002